MSTANEILEMRGYLQDAWDAVGEYGVDTSPTHNIENLVTAVESIGEGALPMPDLSQPLDATGISQLQSIVGSGKASEYLSLGDELLVPYGDYTMPFEVVGFESVVCQVDGVEKNIWAVQLLAKYATGGGYPWGASGNTKYSDSNLRSTIQSLQGQYYSASFVGSLGNTKVQTYSRDGKTDIVYDKLFVPSMEQLGVTDATYNTSSQAVIEGPAFTAYQDATNAKRVRQAISDTGTAQSYWTRSLYSFNFNLFGLVQASGAPSDHYYYDSCRVVVACNMIGPNAEGPTLTGLKKALNDGDAGTLYPIGTEIPDTYNNHANPLIVAQYQDILLPDSTTKPGVYLVRKYAYNSMGYISAFIGNLTTPTLAQNLEADWLIHASEEAINNIAESTYKYWASSTVTNNVICHQFLLDGAQVLAGSHSTSLYPPMDYWKEKTGLSLDSPTSNDGRIVYADDAAASKVGWMLSGTVNSSRSLISTVGALTNPTTITAQAFILAVCAIVKD